MLYAVRTSKWLCHRTVVIVAALAALLTFDGFADAQTLTWSGTGSFQGPGTWDAGTSSNWWNGTANQTWTAGNTAAFGVSTGIGSTVTVSGSVNAGGIVFNPLSVTGATAGSSFTLTGGTIGLGTGNSILTSGAASNTNGLHTIASTLVGSNLSVGRASGAGAGTSPVMGVILSGTNQFLTGTLTVGGTTNTTSVRVLATGSAVTGLSSVVVGANSIFGANADNSVFNFNIQLGAGAQLLNTFGSMTASGTISLAGDNAQLVGNSGKTMTLQGPIVDISGGTAKTLTLFNRGTTVLTGASTFSGTWALGQPNSGGVVILDGGDNRLPAAASLSFTTSVNTLVLGTSAAVNQTIASLTSDVSRSSNALMAGATGTSTLTVNLASGTNTFYGRLGGTGYTMNGNSISNANGNNLALVKSGAGVLVLGNANTYTGTTAVTGGTLLFDPSIYASGTDTTISNLLASTGTITIGSGATLALNGRANQASATLTSGSYNQTSQTVTVASTAGLVPGAIISGSGIAAGTYVQTVVNATQFVTNQAISSGTFSGQSLTVGAANFTTAQSIAGLALSAGTGTVSVSNAGQGTSLTVTGPVTGSGALSKTGDGTLALTGVNTFTGNATLNAGTVLLGTSTVMSGGTIASGPLGTGAISIPAATGTNVTLAGNDSATKRTINNTINIGSSAGTGSVIIGDGVNNASVELAGTITNFWQSRTFTNNLSGNGVLTLSGTMFMDNANATSRVITFNGPGNTVLSGVFVPGVTTTTGGAFIYGGSGTTTLTGSFSYTGATTVSGTGTVILGSSAALGQSGSSAVTISANATLQSQNDALSFSNNWSINSGSQLNVTISGQNSLGLTGTFTNAVSSQTLTNSIASGKLLTLGAINLSESASGRTFTLAGTGNTTIGGVIANGTAAGVAANNLTISNSGTTTLNGANTYAGTTTLSGGVVNLGAAETAGTSGPLGKSAAANAGSIVLSGGTLRYSSANQNDYSGRFSTAASQAYNVDTNGQSVTWATALTSSGGTLTKSGSGVLSLTGSNTFTGATSITAGRLDVGQTGSINSSSGITINGATAEFKYNSATALTKPITFTAGTLSGTGTIGTAVTVGTSDILSPGNSPGSQSFTQGLTFAAGGRYLWEINNWTGPASTNYDQLVVSGSALNITATSGSAFTIAITGLTAGNVAGVVPGFSGTAGTTFTIATSAAGITGFDKGKFSIDTSALTNFNTLPTNAGFWLSTNGGSTSLVLNYAPSATYNLSANATAAAIRVGGTSTITATVASSTALVTNPDSLSYTGLALSGGLGTLSSTSGTLAGGATSSGSVFYTGTAGGAFTFNPSLSTATNVNIGSNANAGTSSGVTVNVYNVASATSSQTVSVGNMYAGSTKTAAVTLANTAPTDATYTETLSSGSFSSTTANFTTSGSVSGIAGGSSGSGTLLVGLGSGLAAGAQSGSTVLSLFTNAVNGSGLGQASVGSQTITITGSVYNMAAAASSQTVSLGNFRVGDTASKGVTLTNTAPANATYTETLGSGSFTNTSVGYTATGSVTGIAGLQSGSGSLAVGFSTTSAGAKSGSTVLSLNSEAVNGSGLGTTGFASQTITITGTVWNYAAASIASGTSINFGTVLKGTSLSQALSITNSAPATFSEKLDASFGTLSGGASTNAGSFGLLAAGGTSTAMTVYLATGSAGAANGSAQLNFTSNGDGTSGLGTASLGSQTVSLAATVLDPAVASFASGSTSSLLTLNFGTVNEGDTVSPLGFSLHNLLQTAGYTADLALINITSGTGNTSALFTNLSLFNTLASGSFNSWQAFVNTASQGTFSNTWTLQFKSSNGGSVYASDTPQSLTLTANVIVVPEPGALALAGIGIGLAGWALWKRRRSG